MCIPHFFVSFFSLAVTEINCVCRILNYWSNCKWHIQLGIKKIVKAEPISRYFIFGGKYFKQKTDRSKMSFSNGKVAQRVRLLPSLNNASMVAAVIELRDSHISWLKGLAPRESDLVTVFK